jgi:hypothetical protein
LKAIIQSLKDENATLKAVASKGRGRRSQREAISESDEQATLAKKYCLTVGPWVDRIHFLQPCPEIDPTSDGAFATEEAIRARTIRELYDYVPEKFHDQLKNLKAFAKVVCAI